MKTAWAATLVAAARIGAIAVVAMLGCAVAANAQPAPLPGSVAPGQIERQFQPPPQPRAPGGPRGILEGYGDKTAADRPARLQTFERYFDLYGDKLMSFAVDDTAATNIVDGDGKAIAQGGDGSDGKPVMMLASVAEQVVQSAINLGGLHQANGYLIRDGKLILVYLEPGQHLAALPESSPQPVQLAMQAE